MACARCVRVAMLAMAASPTLAPASDRDATAEFGRWQDSRFPRAEQRVLADSEVYPGGLGRLPFRLGATVLFARGTPWTQARALRQIRRTAAILEECGIALRQVRLVRLGLPARLRRIDTAAADPQTGVPPTVAEIAAMLPSGTTYPAGFLIGRVEGTKSLAISYRGEDDAGPSAPYFDTAWISYRAHWLPRPDGRYSPLAHEFAHLLCRCGHEPSATRHLLHTSRNFLSSRVLPEHCGQFLKSPHVTVND